MTQYPGYWKGYYFDYNEQTQKDIVITLTFNEFDLHQVNSGQIKGKGKDQQGDMQIWGNVDAQNLSFTKQNKNNTLYFKAKRDMQNHSVRGNWAHDAADLQDGAEGNGSFLLQYIQPRKGWNGFFTQNDIEYQMKFNELNIGSQDGKITGFGSDKKGGSFTIQGTYDTLTKKVAFQKLYQSGIDFFYWGILTNNQILGHWGMYENQPQSSFRLVLLQ